MVSPVPLRIVAGLRGLVSPLFIREVSEACDGGAIEVGTDSGGCVCGGCDFGEFCLADEVGCSLVGAFFFRNLLPLVISDCGFSAGDLDPMDGFGSGSRISDNEKSSISSSVAVCQFFFFFFPSSLPRSFKYS